MGNVLFDTRTARVVDTIADLPASPSNGAICQTKRYSSSHTVGDGSGNLYQWVAGDSTTTDGGFVITGTGGRWHAVDKSVIRPYQFGLVGSGDEGSELQALLDKASAGQIPILLDADTFTTSTDLVFSSNTHVQGELGSGSSYRSRIALTGEARILMHGTDGAGTGWSFQNSLRDVRIVPPTRTAHAVTFDSATETFTLASHGWDAGTLVYLDASAAPSGYTAKRCYYVINPTADTFQLAYYPSGSAINGTTAGTSVTVRLDELIRVGASYWNTLENVGVTDTAAGFLNVTSGNQNTFTDLILDGTGTSTSGTLISLVGGSSIVTRPSVQSALIGVFFGGGSHVVRDMYAETCFHAVSIRSPSSVASTSLQKFLLHGGHLKQNNGGFCVAWYDSANVTIDAIAEQWYSGSTYANYVYGTTIANSHVRNMPRSHWQSSVGAESGNTKLIDFGSVVRTGQGTPESTVTGNVGDLFVRLDGGASTTLYVKESGTGNTGWVAK